MSEEGSNSPQINEDLLESRKKQEEKDLSPSIIFKLNY
jgi:hypothetical protein